MDTRKRRSRIKPAFLICIILSTTSCGFNRGSISDNYKKIVTIASLSPAEYRDYLLSDTSDDVISKLYSDIKYSRAVLDFFTALTESETVAAVILDEAAKNGVPADLAFSLAFEESMFRPTAVNRNENSTDRGLFQLNSKSFPTLSDEEAFDPVVNARAALAYFGICLAKGENEVAALAMYNAGHNRVKGSGTPKSTLDYIARIQSYRENLGKLFEARVVAKRELPDRVSLSLASTAR